MPVKLTYEQLSKLRETIDGHYNQEAEITDLGNDPIIDSTIYAEHEDKIVELIIFCRREDW